MQSPIIIDSFGRMFKTLRLSLTNSCNLGCVYCVSGEEYELTDRPSAIQQDPLSSKDLLKLVENLHSLLNLETIRLTGGEPTLYRELVPLISGIKELGIPKVKMTSNGSSLKVKASSLAQAGLTDLNISLDAIEPEAFYKIARRKNIQRIIEGIDESIASGIAVKINSVIMRGINDNQVLPLFHFASERDITIRYLELMKMGHLNSGNFQNNFFSEQEILDELRKVCSFKKDKRSTSSTANYWTTDQGKTFGIVANESSPFCHDCNRLRLDSFGNIYGCLSENQAISIKENVDDQQALASKLIEALGHKQKIKFKGSEISMLAIGG